MSEAVKMDWMEEDEKPRFEVTNDATAEWALNKIANLKKDTQKWKEHYDHLFETINKQNEESIAYFTGLLRKYFEEVPHHTTKTSESYALPSGTLMLKQQEPTFERDEDKLIGWLKNNNQMELIKIKESVDWAAMKKQLVFSDGLAFDAETGEVVDGIKVVEREDKFDVKIGG